MVFSSYSKGTYIGNPEKDYWDILIRYSRPKLKPLSAMPKSNTLPLFHCFPFPAISQEVGRGTEVVSETLSPREQKATKSVSCYIRWKKPYIFFLGLPEGLSVQKESRSTTMLKGSINENIRALHPPVSRRKARRL